MIPFYYFEMSFVAIAIILVALLVGKGVQKLAGCEAGSVSGALASAVILIFILERVM